MNNIVNIVRESGSDRSANVAALKAAGYQVEVVGHDYLIDGATRLHNVRKAAGVVNARTTAARKAAGVHNAKSAVGFKAADMLLAAGYSAAMVDLVRSAASEAAEAEREAAKAAKAAKAAAVRAQIERLQAQLQALQ